MFEGIFNLVGLILKMKINIILLLGVLMLIHIAKFNLILCFDSAIFQTLLICIFKQTNCAYISLYRVHNTYFAIKTSTQSIKRNKRGNTQEKIYLTFQVLYR